MADERKFRFVSPGIFISEVDRSEIPAQPTSIGPVVMGRTERGPSMVPTVVRSLAEFSAIFGEPQPGSAQPSDMWREGRRNAPLYGAYAALAYLTVGSTPITFIRLAGTNVTTPSGVKGKAGWTIPHLTSSTNVLANAGAYALLAFSGSSQLTGTVAAVFYASGAVIYPSSSFMNLEGMNRILSESNSSEITLVVSSSTTAGEKYRVSLNKSSQYYIRNVFNTNPQLFETGRRYDGATTVEDPNSIKNYFLGESYERSVIDVCGASSNLSFAVVPMINEDAGTSKSPHLSQYRDAQSPWIISQDLVANNTTYTPSRAQKLFKFVSLNGQGEWASSNVKISIDNIKFSVNEFSEYSSFDVVVRQSSDTDLKPVILERYSGVNLNPLSANYIARRIGDQFVAYDDATDQIRTYGDRPNVSRYVRVVVSDDVENGSLQPGIVPFGWHGTIRLLGFSGKTGANQTHVTNAFFANNGYLSSGDYFLSSSHTTASLTGPTTPLRLSASVGGTTHLNAYFGVDTARTSGLTYDIGYVDYTRFMGSDVVSSWSDSFGLGGAPTGTEYEYGFSLDDLVVTTATGYSFSNSPTRDVVEVTFTSGSRAAGTAWNLQTAGNGLPSAASYQNILKIGVRGFTAPMFGGFDGLNVFEREPLRNAYMTDSSTRYNNYVFETYQRAINLITDPEFVDFNLATIPGLTNTTLTKKLIDACETRGDALGLIDVVGGYTPPHEEYKSSVNDRKGSVQTVTTSMDTRNLNNSYGAAYYPWVTVTDPNNGALVRVPPSVVALGVLGNTERVADVWFAPAGFNRGGLTGGASGLVVNSVETKLTSRDRDELYARNINPIASFPAEGIVIFGQKTLLAKNSALNRINVRRLLIFLKKGISRISSTTLFEQNVEVTWNSFKSRADSFLSSVKVRLGLEDYRIVLDGSTTTPDLVDRNILYAKVYVRPAKAIEFIALDFVITRSGASFTD
jgi:hypothetical protein